jgi:hypothetical protein
MGKVKRWFRVQSEPVRKGATEVEEAFLAWMREQSELFGSFDDDGEPWTPGQYSLSRIGTVNDGVLWRVEDDWGWVYVYVLDSGESAEVVVAKSKDGGEVRCRDDVGAAFEGNLDELGNDTEAAIVKWLRGVLRKRDYVVVKSDEESRYTLGIAYPANEVDAHGDFTDAAELEEAAWNFMVKSRNIGTDHEDGTDFSGTVVESYIYRGPDWTSGEETITPGDWLVGAVWAEESWDRVKKGELTGWSIQGLALIDEDAEEPDDDGDA